MTPQDFYERQCERWDRELEAGVITQEEYFQQTSALRHELQAELRERKYRREDGHDLD